MSSPDQKNIPVVEFINRPGTESVAGKVVLTLRLPTGVSRSDITQPKIERREQVPLVSPASLDEHTTQPLDLSEGASQRLDVRQRSEIANLAELMAVRAQTWTRIARLLRERSDSAVLAVEEVERIQANADHLAKLATHLTELSINIG